MHGFIAHAENESVCGVHKGYNIIKCTMHLFWQQEVDV